MFLFTADFFGVAASSIAAVAYVYFPYHLMTIYLYGGYGEAMAYVLLPLVFLFFVDSYVDNPSCILQQPLYALAYSFFPIIFQPLWQSF